MIKIYEFLANGFEEIEALAPVDILRRGGLDIKMVSITGSEYVESSHGIIVKTDLIFEQTLFNDADMLLLPGGMPGAKNLNEHEGLRELIVTHYNIGKRIGAICAAPMVLGSLGLLEGKRATCSPGFEKYMQGAEYTRQLFTIDGNIITGEGPAATLPYAYKILSFFVNEETVGELKERMQYAHLMEGNN